MIKRIITGLILLAISIMCIIKGGLALGIGMYLFALFITYEIAALYNAQETKLSLIVAAGMVSFFFLTLALPSLNTLWSLPYFKWIYIGMYIGCGIELMTGKLAVSNQSIWNTLRIGLFVGLTMPLYSLIHIKAGWEVLLFCAVLVWGTDTFAYFGGRAFGRHPLSKYSPNKTLEGSAAGILGSMVIAYVFFQTGILPWSLEHLLKLAVVISVIGQLGDLHESFVKRSFSVKDTSALLPGHGGFYDRLDSTLFVAPLFYFFIL